MNIDHLTPKQIEADYVALSRLAVKLADEYYRNHNEYPYGFLISIEDDYKMRYLVFHYDPRNRQLNDLPVIVSSDLPSGTIGVIDKLYVVNPDG